MAKAKVPSALKKEVCKDCWARFHTQYNEKTKEKEVLDYCPIGVHVLTTSEKCESRDHKR